MHSHFISLDTIALLYFGFGVHLLQVWVIQKEEGVVKLVEHITCMSEGNILLPYSSCLSEITSDSPVFEGLLFIPLYVPWEFPSYTIPIFPVSFQPTF